MVETIHTAVRTQRAIAVIMGGGAGTRLFPLTKDRSKPAVPLAGSYRLVDIPISNCINSGLRRIYLLTQFNSSSLHRHIQRAYRFDNIIRGFVEILAAQQGPREGTGWYQGTADAVRQNLTHFANEPHDLVVILSGDQLYRMDFRELIAEHLNRGWDISIATIPVNREAAKGFGIMQVDEQGRIIRFVEKPKDEELLNSLALHDLDKITKRAKQWPGPEFFLASMGIYVFNRSVLSEVLDNKLNDFGKDIIPAAISKYKVGSYVYQGYWEDIGTIGSFFRANLDLTENLPQFNLFDEENKIFSETYFLPPAKVERCDVERTLMSPGCIVQGARMRRVLLGVRSVVRGDVIMEDVVMMGADMYEAAPASSQIPLGIGERTTVRNAIIDKNARIGTGCVLTPQNFGQHHDGGWFYVRDGILVIPKNTAVPDYTDMTRM